MSERLGFHGSFVTFWQLQTKNTADPKTDGQHFLRAYFLSGNFPTPIEFPVVFLQPLHNAAATESTGNAPSPNYLPVVRRPLGSFPFALQRQPALIRPRSGSAKRHSTLSDCFPMPHTLGEIPGLPNLSPTPRQKFSFHLLLLWLQNGHRLPSRCTKYINIDILPNTKNRNV